MCVKGKMMAHSNMNHSLPTWENDIQYISGITLPCVTHFARWSWGKVESIFPADEWPSRCCPLPGISRRAERTVDSHHGSYQRWTFFRPENITALQSEGDEQMKRNGKNVNYIIKQLPEKNSKSFSAITPWNTHWLIPLRIGKSAQWFQWMIRLERNQLFTPLQSQRLTPLTATIL